MRIDYLANHMHLMDEVTNLVYQQWSDLFEAAGTSEEGLRELFVARAVTDRLPIAVVALSGTVLVGTGSIKLSEPGTKPGLSPWLAGIYVKEKFRRTGVGTLLVRALESTATELGVETLFLSVGAAPGFYERLGWIALDRVLSCGVKEVTIMAKSLSPLSSCAAPTTPVRDFPSARRV